MIKGIIAVTIVLYLLNRFCSSFLRRLLIVGFLAFSMVKLISMASPFVLEGMYFTLLVISSLIAIHYFTLRK